MRASVRSACVKRTRGMPVRGHRRIVHFRSRRARAAFCRKKCEKERQPAREKSESSRSATDTATDYECIDRRINNGRITADTRADRSLDFRPFFFPAFFCAVSIERANARAFVLLLFRMRYRGPTRRREVRGLIECFFNYCLVFSRIYRGKLHEKKGYHARTRYTTFVEAAKWNHYGHKIITVDLGGSDAAFARSYFISELADCVHVSIKRREKI